MFLEPGRHSGDAPSPQRVPGRSLRRKAEGGQEGFHPEEAYAGNGGYVDHRRLNETQL